LDKYELKQTKGKRPTGRLCGKEEYNTLQKMSHRKKEGHGRKRRRRSLGKTGIDREGWLLGDPHKWKHSRNNKKMNHTLLTLCCFSVRMPQR
jgi:hypothetical protein